MTIQSDRIAEIKQLKEELIRTVSDFINLKKELEKQSSWTTEMYNQAEKSKQKLEKIEMWIMVNVGLPLCEDKELKEILERKE